MASTPQLPDRALIKRSHRGPGSHYSDFDVEAALTQLALLGGSIKKTNERIGVPIPTLQAWKRAHSERYDQLRQSLAPTIEREIIKNERDFALRAQEVKLQALDATSTKIATGELRDTASALKNISIAQDVSIRTALTLEGRPTQITSHVSTDDILAELSEKGFIEGTAEEDPLNSPTQIP